MKPVCKERLNRWHSGKIKIGMIVFKSLVDKLSGPELAFGLSLDAIFESNAVEIVEK